MVTELLGNRYRLEQELGSGGTGTIYRAYDTLLDRHVAVKLLASKGLGSQGRASLLREAQAAARLNHPNIVSIYDAGEADGSAYIIMELVTGASLHEEPPETLEQTLATFRQICAALEHAHQNRIVHRDLKPENVLISQEGKVKLTDFGLARPVATRLSIEGVITGTVYYIAPEQALGEEISQSADLYSLGVMLYEAVTGQLPFVGDNPITILTQHLYAPPVPPHVRNPQLPAELDNLILQLMSKNPTERPASAGEVMRRLEQLSLKGTLAVTFPQPDLLERMARGRIVGREREMLQARRLWERIQAGEGLLWLISGEPGIGKTRLVREVVTLVEVTGGKTFVGECYPEGGAPYAPIAQIIRRALAFNPQRLVELPENVLADLLLLAPDLQSRYPEVQPNPRLEPISEQQRLFENLVEFFITLSRVSPCLLVLEDAHWADQASLAFLRYLARRTLEQRLMIVITYREVDLDEALPLQDMLIALTRDRLAERLKLTRLDQVATRMMLAALLCDDPPQRLVEAIYRETEGNPFFIEEVCKALLESGQLACEDGGWKQPDLDNLVVPQSVRLTIQSRLSKLPPFCQEVLRSAAILGREFDFETLQRVEEDKDEEQLIEALERAEHAQLVEELSSARGGAFRFVHALIPLTLVESLSGLRRRRLHRRSASVIEKLRPDDLEALAYQYSQAEEPEKALYYLRLVGDKASQRYANEDALRAYTQALEFCEERGRKRFEILAAQAAVLHLVAKRERQLAVISEMQSIAEELGQDDLRFEALIALIDYFAITDYTLARQPCQEALALAQALGDPPREGRALRRLADIAFQDGDQHRSIHFLEAALPKFELSGLMDETISSLYLLSLNYINSGEREKGQLKAEKALALSRQIKDRRLEATSLRRLGIAMRAQDRKDEALVYYQEALELHRAVGDRAEECNALNAIGALLVEMDRLEEARPYFLQGLELAEATFNDLAIGMLLSNYVDGYFLRQGDLEGALELIESKQKTVFNNGDRSQGFILARMKNEVLAYLGQYQRAIDEAEKALSLAEQRKDLRSQIDLLSWLGRLYAMAGQPEKGAPLLAASLERLTVMDASEDYVDPYFNAAYMAWLSGDPTAWQTGLKYARQISAFWRKVRLPYALMFSLDMEARLLLLMGEKDAALASSLEAIKIAESQGRTTGLAQIFSTHAFLLEQLNQPDQARHYLEKAYEVLMESASKLSDEALQHSFLYNVREHRAILEAMQKLE